MALELLLLFSYVGGLEITNFLSESSLHRGREKHSIMASKVPGLVCSIADIVSAGVSVENGWRESEKGGY